MNTKLWKAIKKRILIYPLVGIIACCASPIIKFKGNHKNIDPKIEPYVKYIYELSHGKLDGTNMSMGFVLQNKLNKDYFAGEGRNILGVCTLKWGGIKHELDFSKEAWMNLSVRRKLLLVAHEIRHCYCYEYRHKSTLLKNGCPYSYMYPSLMGNNCIIKNYNHYINEIKRGCD